MNPVTQINFISIKPDKVDEFFEADRRFVASSRRPLCQRALSAAACTRVPMASRRSG
jgi:hypothetical protein